MANNESSSVAPPFVPDNWKRLSLRDQSSLKQNLRMSLEDHLKLENSMLGLQSTLNFLSWMWDSALQELRESETRPGRPVTFNLINEAASRALLECLQYAYTTSTFLVQQRKSFYVNQLPGLVDSVDRKKLLAEPATTSSLFSQDLVDKMADSLKDNAARKSHMNVEKILVKKPRDAEQTASPLAARDKLSRHQPSYSSSRGWSSHTRRPSQKKDFKGRIKSSKYTNPKQDQGNRDQQDSTKKFFRR